MWELMWNVFFRYIFSNALWIQKLSCAFVKFGLEYNQIWLYYETARLIFSKCAFKAKAPYSPKPFNKYICCVVAGSGGEISFWEEAREKVMKCKESD